LLALFRYFGHLSTSSGFQSQNYSISQWPISYTLKRLTISDEKLNFIADRSIFAPLHIKYIPMASTESSLLALPSGACVISANKSVGFGRSGTQEETHVGTSPEACPVALLTPPLQDTDVLVVEGPEAMATVTGYGRQARFDSFIELDPDDSPESSKWRRRTMLFMDALELDLYEESHILPDLLPGHLYRELRKAYTAFASEDGEKSTYSDIYTGLWGCGAFGGNKYIKSLVQWFAASMAKVSITFVCSDEIQHAFAKDLEKFAEAVFKNGWNVMDVLQALKVVDCRLQKSEDIFSSITAALKAS
jgi:poly(ADP-ribose) glycohydrolase